MQRDKDKETHSVDIQFDDRHSQTFRKLVDDVNSENLVYVTSTNKKLFNCFIANTLGKLLKALSDINGQCSARLTVTVEEPKVTS